MLARRSRDAPSSEAVPRLTLVPAAGATSRTAPEWSAEAESLEPIEHDEAPRPGRHLSRAVSVPAVTGAAVFVAAVIIAIVVTVLQMRPAAEAASRFESSPLASISENAPGAAADGASDGGAPGASNAAASEGSSARIYVHVIGEVARPGVIEVENGARLADVIEAAGGANEAAVLDSVNLARRAVDGEQVLVPNAEQAAAGALAGGGTGAAAGGGAGAAAASGGAVVGGGLVNLNTADPAALESLPRVGPALAQRILDWRTANGGFSSIEQLLDVSGIGQKTLDGFRDRVTV